ncbi:hypothetical protein [Glutamicibacter arilaitensis]|uniref:Uncharacterized protein n=1 Tax=Glutamicibacter arilaitensis TaxID=256701 RepID=A0A2N7RZB4_9MICC|nr:hypothetical protein [Glutamicibacter arilaitensis]PMQ19235.1 hypothetical protein CIK84_10965 [Glutamicibacter arilaitensis]
MAKKVRKSKEYRKPNQFEQLQNQRIESNARSGKVQSTSHENKSNPMLLISVGLIIGVVLFVYYHLLTLVQMQDLSGSLPMPDQRIFGYTLGDIEALRNAMDDDAVGQLNYLHKTAGFLFPMFTAIFSMLLFIYWIPNRQTRWLAWIAPLGFAAIDIWENFAIDALFTGELSESAVVLASILTTTRWALFIITAGLVLGLGAVRANRALKAKMLAIREGTD